MVGSGNPGVTATGQSGDGVTATTNLSGKAAVRGTTATAGAVGIAASHTGSGVALGATTTTTSNSEIPTARFTNTGEGLVLEVTGSQGSRSMLVDGFVSVKAAGAGACVDLANPSEQGVGLAIREPQGPSVATGVDIEGANVGVDVAKTRIGLRVATTQHHIELVPAPGAAPPVRTNVAGQVGAIVAHGSDLWLCVASGAPGTWRRLGGAATAGALEVLDVPGRAYDSRPNTTPAVGSKTALQPNVARVIDLTGGGTVPIPAGATAAVLTILLVNATAGNGNLTVWANGAPRPLANTMVWGGNAGRFTTTAVSRVDAQARVQVVASLATHIVIDVVGFHR